MSHATHKQAKKLKELGYPQLADTGAVFSLTALKEVPAMSAPLLMIHDDVETLKHPSAEELMEWLKEHIKFSISVSENKWQVAIEALRDGEFCAFNFYVEEELINALFQATCWVLEGKK